jgi:transcriptional regulator with XRE-family HTH domain
MQKEKNNRYQVCRLTTGYSQEVAAEKLGISVESIRAYENGYRLPPNSIVTKMMAIYGASRLFGISHLSEDELIKKCLMLPEDKPVTLSESVLTFISEYNDVGNHIAQIMKIACDNKIDGEQIPEWQSITREIDELYAAALELIAVSDEQLPKATPANTKERSKKYA